MELINEVNLNLEPYPEWMNPPQQLFIGGQQHATAAVNTMLASIAQDNLVVVLELDFVLTDLAPLFSGEFSPNV